MVDLLELPIEILTTIVSFLKVVPAAFKESERIRNRQAILPLSQTNRVLWMIARPVIYHDIEIRLRNPTSKAYELSPQATLLYRTFQEYPELRTHVKTLKLKGLVKGYGGWQDPSKRDTPRKRLPSIVLLNASQLDNYLASFPSTRRFKVYTFGGLHKSIHHETNQIILSCLKSMTMLQRLDLEVGRGAGKAYADLLIHFLNVVSTTLRILCIEPFRRYPNPAISEEHPEPGSVAPLSKLNLLSLDLPAERLSLASFYPWINKLESLRLSNIVLSNNRTNQGPNMHSILAPLASNLRQLILWFGFKGDAPNLSDLDVTQCPVLEALTYGAPWFIRTTYEAVDVCQALLSKPYRTLNLHITQGYRGPKIELESIRILKEAFNLAHQRDLTPGTCSITFNFYDIGAYTYTYSLKQSIKFEVDSLKKDLFDRNVNVDGWCITYPGKQKDEDNEAEVAFISQSDSEYTEVDPDFDGVY
jgi:hypothetical protein